ncbi:MAG: DNA mismatch repair endonuclease MutL [Firmicutes bacterium]|nr:DNA mismatch repair endonuclease MutL [Bacillota bacterium]
MKPIIQLDQSLINKIAAGEVVERPLSVVKELTENAIDARATVITVEITDGGLTMVRVTDNGGGISADELQLAFSRHATSKIASLDDLFQVQTLGFRGEALSSIAAVSQVEMITKTPHAVMGTRVEIHGGVIQSRQSIGCANGTTVVVANLFYNTPARRKFLKKPPSEAGYISDCLQRLALGNPGLQLRYINNGKIIFQSGGNGDLKTAMLNIYGREVATKVIDVDASQEELRLFGLVGKPETARGNRQHGTFFINGRYIQSRLLTNAIESAMKTMLPAGKFPLFALNLSLPFDMLDVNVHPTKMDVRFAEEDAIFSFVEEAVREALSEHNLIPSVRQKAKSSESVAEQEQLSLFPTYPEKPVEEPLSEKELADLFSPDEEPERDIETVIRELYLNPSKAISAKEKTNFTSADLPEQRQISAEELSTPSLPKPRFFSTYQIHSLIFNTYWLVTQEESLYLIDQHAAHERVLYERLLATVRERAVSSQQLLLPIPLRLTPREKQTLADNMEYFNNFGFEISADDDNPDDYTITAVPLLFNGPLHSGFFSDLLDKIDEVGFSKESAYDHKTELIAMASCKAAVKGGDNLSEQEAHALITQLLELENPFTCPHGRPTIIEFTRQELERRFKRS